MDGTNQVLAVALVILAVVGLFIVGGRVTASRARQRVIVMDYQTGLLIKKGRVDRVLGPGVYSTWLTTNTIEVVDTREQSTPVSGQEVLTSDLMPVKLSLVIRYSIADPKLHRTAHGYPASRMHEEIQLEIRRRVAALTLDAFLAGRDAVMSGFSEQIDKSLAPYGFKIVAVDLRDVMPAGPARQAFADIWKAQKEGLAALERARGEQASLRLLANAARLLKGNPELMNLRLLQAVSSGQGKTSPTIVLGGATGLLPVSGEAASSEGADGGS